jgi:hypothetical protein
VESHPPTLPSPSPLKTLGSDGSSANMPKSPAPETNLPLPNSSSTGNEQRDKGVDSSSSTQTEQPNTSETPLKILEQTETIVENLPKDSFIGNYVKTETLEGTKIDAVETGLTESIAISSVTQNLNIKPDGYRIILVEAGSVDQKSEGVTIGNLSETVTSEGVTRISVGGDQARAQADKLGEKVRNDLRPVSQATPPVTESNEQQRPSQPSMDPQIKETSETHKGEVIGQMVTQKAQLGGTVVSVETGEEKRTGMLVKGDVISTGPTNISVIQNEGTSGQTAGMVIQGSFSTDQSLTVNIGPPGNFADSDFSNDTDSD